MAWDLGGVLLSGSSEVQLAGKSRKIEHSLVDMKLGASPDTSWFQVPSGFQISDAKPRAAQKTAQNR